MNTSNQIGLIGKKVVKWTVKLPIYLYVPLAYILMIGLFLPTIWLGMSMGLSETDFSKLGIPNALWAKLLLVVALGPLFETLILQAAPYYFLNLFEFMKRRPWLSILLPGIVFGLLHSISFQYFLITCVMGLVFQFTYHVRSIKGDPFVSTFLLHVLLNGLSVLYTYILV
jgi:hypothetical protein